MGVVSGIFGSNADLFYNVIDAWFMGKFDPRLAVADDYLILSASSKFATFLLPYVLLGVRNMRRARRTYVYVGNYSEKPLGISLALCVEHVINPGTYTCVGDEKGIETILNNLPTGFLILRTPKWVGILDTLERKYGLRRITPYSILY